MAPIAPPATKRQPAAQLPRAVLELLRPHIPVPQPQPASDKVEALGTPVIARQQITTIPSTYGSLDSGPGPGQTVGIVLGSVAGFVLVLWVIYTCVNIGNPSGIDDVSSVVTHKSRRARRRSHHHGARPRSATVEIRTTTRGPTIVEEIGVPDEAIIVEERRRRSVSRGPRVRTVGSDEDEVVVIEETSPPPRTRRHRSTSVRRSVERRSSGYREVDPDRFGGGDTPMREIRRSTSRRRYD